MIPRLFQPPAQSFLLFGPLGTWKSTWAAQAFPLAHHIDLREPGTQRESSTRPERLLDVLAGRQSLQELAEARARYAVS